MEAVAGMITKEEAQRQALVLRVRAFQIIDDRERRFAGYWLGADPYPAWAREMDRQAGNLFAEAERLIKLASGPVWRRWFR